MVSSLQSCRAGRIRGPDQDCVQSSSQEEFLLQLWGMRNVWQCVKLRMHGDFADFIVLHMVVVRSLYAVVAWLDELEQFDVN